MPIYSSIFGQIGLGIDVVYKIPYRRARAWPGRVRRASKGILHTSIDGESTA